MANTLCSAAFIALPSVANTDDYRFICGGPQKSTTEAQVETKFQSAGILSNLWVKVTANTVAATSTFTLRKNAGD